MDFIVKITVLWYGFCKSSIKSTRTPALLAAVGFFKAKREFDFFLITVEQSPDPRVTTNSRKPYLPDNDNVRIPEVARGNGVQLKFSGAGVVTPLGPPPPTNNFCLYPPF